MVISDFWQCQLGAQSIIKHMAANNYTITKSTQIKDTASDEELDKAFMGVAKVSRSTYICLLDLF